MQQNHWLSCQEEQWFCFSSTQWSLNSKSNENVSGAISVLGMFLLMSSLLGQIFTDVQDQQ